MSCVDESDPLNFFFWVWGATTCDLQAPCPLQVPIVSAYQEPETRDERWLKQRKWKTSTLIQCIGEWKAQPHLTLLCQSNYFFLYQFQEFQPSFCPFLPLLYFLLFILLLLSAAFCSCFFILLWGSWIPLFSANVLYKTLSWCKPHKKLSWVFSKNQK